MQQQMPQQQLQEMMREQAEQRLTLLQLQEMQRRYWERLFLTTVEMSEPELRATLKHRSSDRRFAAAYVVGERLLGWPEDLIPLLEDGSEAVRQAARRSLIILSFLTLNPEEARRTRSPQRGGPVTPLSELKSAVDFGPQPGATRSVRAKAVKEWKEWWAAQGPQLSTLDSRAAADRTEGGRLASALAQVRPESRQEIVTKYRDSKGVQYTEALALAIAREAGDARRQLREALAERMARMTEKTLGQYLEDEDAEVRRAAALGLAMRESKAHFAGLIGLLLDPQPSVERAAHAALCSLSGEDFGPRVNATEAEKTEAAARWRRWQGGKR
ncbi:MAG TPA: HEAT repeat domain-containing protein [Gemmataceae bacterium]|jgi:HEAT repeat protein|nr:HEAT repeat domain-containing protein [Gemmataceae bacterium]